MRIAKEVVVRLDLDAVSTIHTIVSQSNEALEVRVCDRKPDKLLDVSLARS